MDTLVYIGKILKERRLKNEKLGLCYKTKDVSSALGISRQLLNHYETGKRKIQFDLFWRWCDVLGISHRTVIEKVEKELKKAQKENAQNEIK